VVLFCEYMDCKAFIEKLRSALATHVSYQITEEGLTRAAVLVPLFCKDGELHILLTRRSSSVRHHKNQVSFPGGVCDKEDCSLKDTALREAMEEIGLKRDDAEVLGQLDDVVTKSTRFVISPFIALIPFPYRFNVNGREIDQMLEVPISHIRDKTNSWTEYPIVDGVKRTSHYYRFQENVIWGATARVVDALMELVFAERGALG
jgi:8-oxo-dGTP pyrophosphatase MutT (NUDIX family)